MLVLRTIVGDILYYVGNLPKWNAFYYIGKQNVGHNIKKMKSNLNAVHDKDLEKLLENLNLKEKLEKGELKCKFTGEIITLDNLHSIFPESGTIKLVSDSPDAIKQLSEYLNEKDL